MKLKIIDQREMPLLQRKVIRLELENEQLPTPKKEDIAKEVTSLLKTKESLLKVKNIYPCYGEGKTEIKAFVYDNEDALKTFEKQKVKKESGKEKGQGQKKQ